MTGAPRPHHPLTYFLSMRVTSAIIGALLGAGLPFSFNMLEDLQDRFSAVVDMHGVLISKTDRVVVLHITGTKIKDCRYIGVQGYIQDKNGRLHEVDARRIDAPEGGYTRPPGVYDLGRWEVALIPGGRAALLFVSHDCHGHLRFSSLAEVPL